ncbi:MAG: hypothetical protein U0K81_02375 [Paludibacteraceae bacterium]|nr:hypothetical protein [Paludibacteraceae bacterium]
MLTFDKLKIVVKSTDFIDNLNLNKFQTIVQDGVVTQYRYQQTTPYILYIEKDLVDNELVIEFTGKILGVQYPELINQTTIRQCFDTINALGICTMDVDSILTFGNVVKADVTKDIEYNDIASLSKELLSCIKNNERYNATCESGNFIVEKKVKTSNRKMRLTIYDKEKEMSLAENQRWLQSLGYAEAEQVTDYFRKKIRFELNLTSIKALKDNLSISDTSLSTVLGAETNPIMPFLDKVLVDNAEARVAKSVRDIERLAFMEKLGYDLKAIERAILPIKSPKTNLSQVMKPYHLLYNALNANTSRSLKERLKNALFEIFIIGFFVSI